MLERIFHIYKELDGSFFFLRSSDRHSICCIFIFHNYLGVFSRWYPIGQRILHPEIAGVKSLFSLTNLHL